MSHRPLLARAWRAAAALALVLALAPEAARAVIAPEAKPIVERYLEATGGRAAWEATRSTYTRMTLEAFGFKGSAEAWSAAPDHEATAVVLGPFNIQAGFDGTRGWRTDPSGKLVMLDGKDLEEARASAWFGAERWAAADQGGGTVTYAGTEKDSAGTYAVLEITPPVGRARKAWFDTRTGLLARTVAAREVQTVVTAYSDHRPRAGRVYAHRVVQSVVGMPANTLVQTLDSVAVGVEIPASRFAPPGEGGAPVTWLRQPGRATLPFDYRGRHVWLRASVNGMPPADFLYDTGASMTVLDSAWAARNGIRTEGTMQGHGAGASGGVSFARLQTLRVEGTGGDGIEMKDVQVGVLSVNAMLAPFFWRDCAGIIGFNVLGQFVNRIDYDARALTFWDPKTFTYEGRGTEVPFRLAGFIPVVPMTIDGAYSGEFRLDVGSSSTVDLHTPFVKQHGLLEKQKRTLEVMGGGFGGTFTNRLTRMKTLTLGPYTWQEPLLSLHTGEEGMLASGDYAGNVGNQILERFAVTLDYERRKAWFEPSSQVAKRDAFSRFGAQLVLMEGVVRAAQVLPGSAAAAAGVRTMDEVVSIDGKAAREYDPDAINRMFEERAAGTRVRLELRRDGKVIKATAVLKEII